MKKVCINSSGGSTSSVANKNEDAMFIIHDEEECWTFAVKAT